jgi:gliding motility-associated-like protein
VASGTASGPIALAVGTNTITTIVTSQDGTASKTYTITVTRSPSTNDNLSSIKLSSGTLSPAFSAATTSYTTSVANVTSSLTLTPATAVNTSTVAVNGTTVSSGTASGPISLSVGTNAITTTVTAQDGITAKTYTITVTRAASANASLSAFKISRGTLSPVFSTNTTTYTASVVNGVSTMTVTPTSADPTATINVNGALVTSGTESGSLALAVGANTINTVVTAQDGTTTKTYTLTVTRVTGATDGFDQGISVTNPGETPALNDDGVVVHQAVSPNGDGINDFLTIDNITSYPDNKLTIMNRNGQLVYQAGGYDNSSKIFDGHSSKNGRMELPGTYFYQLDYTVNGITRHKTGFIVLKY